jgi:peptide/nickel transport system permease protein
MANTRARLRHLTPLGVVTAFAALSWLLLAVLGPPLLGERASRMDPSALGLGSSWEHPFGTDQTGRDILARTIVATRLSLQLALLSLAIGAVVGTVVGTLPMLLGRRAGRLVVAAINIAVSFPGFLIAMFLSVVLGIGAGPAVLALGMAIAPGYARLTHNVASRVASADYVVAARLLGVRGRRLVTRHVLPNIADALISYSVSAAGAALLAFSALSYLGFGVQAPSYDWGRMLSEGLQHIYTNPVAALLPCLAIAAAGTTFVLAGEYAVEVVSGRSVRARRSGDEAATAAKNAPAAASAASEPTDAVLDIHDLRVRFPGEDAPSWPVRRVSLRIGAGEVVGLVGESGSGKSMTGAAVTDLIPYPGVVEAARLNVCGRDLRDLGGRARRRLLGAEVVTVFQDPMSALNPALRVGRQLGEVVEVHQGRTRAQGLARAVAMLAAVRVPEPERRVRQYPGELSGGLRQRAVIAMGLMGTPRLVIADEPTTALDVTVQKEILALLLRIREETGAGMLFVSHDLGVISQVASRVVVMYAGYVVEELSVAALTDGAAHPYTRALVASVPDMTTDKTLPLATIDGAPPGPDEAITGCPFAARCAHAQDRCRAEMPDLLPTRSGGVVACWFPQESAGVVGAAGEMGAVR